MGLKSLIIFNKSSYIEIGCDVSLKDSILRVSDSNLFLGKNSRLSVTRLTINNSTAKFGRNQIFENILFSINEQSVVTAGDFNLYTKGYYYKNGVFVSSSVVQFGNNVNIYAHLKCLGASFTAGNNIFINAGTEIRCTEKITIGNNVFISYECIIFDTNTHSIVASDRLQEMLDGYPNNAIQNAEIKRAIKASPIYIGNDVWIGMRSAILKGSYLGINSVVGTCTVVTGTVPDNCIAVGNPFSIKPLK